jgi:hypothetical protein
MKQTKNDNYYYNQQGRGDQISRTKGEPEYIARAQPPASETSVQYETLPVIPEMVDVKLVEEESSTEKIQEAVRKVLQEHDVGLSTKTEPPPDIHVAPHHAQNKRCRRMLMLILGVVLLTVVVGIIAGAVVALQGGGAEEEEACTGETDAVVDCVSLELGENTAYECLDCVTDSVPTSAHDCSDIEQQFCSDFISCDCGSCTDEILAMMDCGFDENPNFPDCDIDCEGWWG